MKKYGYKEGLKELREAATNAARKHKILKVLGLLGTGYLIGKHHTESQLQPIQGYSSGYEDWEIPGAKSRTWERPLTTQERLTRWVKTQSKPGTAKRALKKTAIGAGKVIGRVGHQAGSQAGSAAIGALVALGLDRAIRKLPHGIRPDVKTNVDQFARSCEQVAQYALEASLPVLQGAVTTLQKKRNDPELTAAEKNMLSFLLGYISAEMATRKPQKYGLREWWQREQLIKETRPAWHRELTKRRLRRAGIAAGLGAAGTGGYVAAKHRKDYEIGNPYIPSTGAVKRRWKSRVWAGTKKAGKFLGTAANVGLGGLIAVDVVRGMRNMTRPASEQQYMSVQALKMIPKIGRGIIDVLGPIVLTKEVMDYLKPATWDKLSPEMKAQIIQLITEEKMLRDGIPPVHSYARRLQRGKWIKHKPVLKTAKPSEIWINDKTGQIMGQMEPLPKRHPIRTAVLGGAAGAAGIMLLNGKKKNEKTYALDPEDLTKWQKLGWLRRRRIGKADPELASELNTLLSSLRRKQALKKALPIMKTLGLVGAGVTGNELRREYAKPFSQRWRFWRKRPRVKTVAKVGGLVGLGAAGHELLRPLTLQERQELGYAIEMYPMQSQAQRRFLWANKPDVAREFEEKTPKGKKLPERKEYAMKRPGQGFNDVIRRLSRLTDSTPRSEAVIRELQNLHKRTMRRAMAVTGGAGATGLAIGRSVGQVEGREEVKKKLGYAAPEQYLIGSVVRPLASKAAVWLKGGLTARQRAAIPAMRKRVKTITPFKEGQSSMVRSAKKAQREVNRRTRLGVIGAAGTGVTGLAAGHAFTPQHKVIEQSEYAMPRLRPMQVI